jgi:hypothetical protein
LSRQLNTQQCVWLFQLIGDSFGATRCLSGFLFTGVPAHARQSDQQTQPDNTANNKGDNSKAAATADNQREFAADRDL